MTNLVQDTEENMEKCICGGCPTYNECMKGKAEGLFCARGKSTCEMEMLGCICGECPVAEENNLTKTYYCGHGAATEESEKGKEVAEDNEESSDDSE